MTRPPSCSPSSVAVRPRDLDAASMRWYAWASATIAGEVVAWDYAPDTAWVGLPPGTEP